MQIAKIMSKFKTKDEAQKVADSSMYNDVKLIDELNSRFLFILIVLVMIGILDFCFKASHSFIASSDGLSKEASKRDFCSMAMNQMIKKKLSKKVITEGLYSLITSNDYKNLFLSGEEVVQETFAGDEKCKVIIKGTEGVRAFDFYLEEGIDENFYYQIKKITEHELYEKEA